MGNKETNKQIYITGKNWEYPCTRFLRSSGEKAHHSPDKTFQRPLRGEGRDESLSSEILNERDLLVQMGRSTAWTLGPHGEPPESFHARAVLEDFT